MFLKKIRKIIGIRGKHKLIGMSIISVIGMCIVGLIYIDYKSKDIDISSNNGENKTLQKNHETQKEIVLMLWRNILNSRNSGEEKFNFQKLINHLNENEIKTPDIIVIDSNGEKKEYSYTDGLPKNDFGGISMIFHLSGNDFTPREIRKPKDINTFYILFLE